MSLLYSLRGLPRSLQAAVFMALAMLFFTSMGIFIRLAAEELHSLEIVFFRNFLAFLLMAPWILRQGINVMYTRRLGLYSFRALVNLVGMAAGFTAITMMPLAEFTALSFTAPLWVTLGAWFFLRETVRGYRLVAIIVGFFGVMVVLQPGFTAISIASGLALVHASLIAGTTLIVKRLTVTERPEAIVTYMVLLQAPLALIPALFVWQWPTFMGWVWLWALAGGATLGHIFWTRAVRIAEVTQLQPLEFIRLPVAGLFAFMLFAEVPTIWTWIGGAVIFIATALVTRAEVAASR